MTSISPDVERAVREYLQATGVESADPAWVRLVVLVVKLRFVGEDRPPRVQITRILIRWDGERAAYSNEDTHHDSYMLEAIFDQFDAESIPFTELFMTLDRDGVLNVQVDDLEMHTTDEPLMHPHWNRAIEHLDFCAEDVAAMLERLRDARALPGQSAALWPISSGSSP